jgi:protein-S-isoprenylcysteine O-methyltransferase Ste14
VKAAIYTVIFFFVAPGANAVLVPWLITGWDAPAQWPVAWVVVGALVACVGLLVVVACFARFVTEGHGTPAPVAPTDTLVVGGIYRYVRNPMYVGVAAMIGGQALAFASWGTLVWMLVFLAAVGSFVTFYEEPTLTRQFGPTYQRYREEVPGWWPRLTPYRAD